jgi:ankyrin repeat protein
MPLTLPARPDFDQLRKQAKDLLSAWRDGEELQLLQEHHPEKALVDQPQKLRLSDAQLVTARRYGFSSWPRLKAEVELLLMAFSERAKHFVRLAADPYSGLYNQRFWSAKRLLAREPSLSRADLYTALVMGDSAPIKKHLSKNPAWARQRGGPCEDRAPLLYVAYSRFHVTAPKIAEGLLAIAELLLSHGANVNDTFEIEGSVLGSLYGACGVTNFPEMAQILIEHGATLDDGESLYHATEFADNRCLELLLRSGASTKRTNALHHALDRRDTAALALLLQYGADPNEDLGSLGGSLHSALDRGHGTEVLSLLLDAGADLEKKRADGRTAYQLALLCGHTEAARFLASKGAATASTAFERFVDACARHEVTNARAIVQAEPDLFAKLNPHERDGFLRVASQGKRGVVVAMLDCGFPINAKNSSSQSALHHAAWNGQREIVKLLIERGAELDAKEDAFGSTPLGWAAHGGQNCVRPGADHVGAIRLLIEAGADIHTTNKWGEGILFEGENQIVVEVLRAAGVKSPDD